ncbi:MAG: PAS domain-containing protein [Methanomicrobiaceae archaeon]|nr:PAS domain-containing protein [Methanomicrobiaceae archaeon]
MHILVIEDNPADVYLIREVLSEQQGVSFDIFHADNLSSGLSRLSGGGIDVILLDLGLPDSQGIDTVRAVSGHPSDVPIVVLTGLDDEETGVRALQEGAQDYLVKGGMSGPSLVRAIRYAIERNRIERALRESEERARRHAEELEKLMNLVPAGIWVSQDPDCRTITGNRAANRLFEAREGENVSFIPAPGRRDSTRRFFKNGRELRIEELPIQTAASRGIEVRDSEVDVLLPSGKYITILGNASPLLDADGRVRGCIGAFIDITDRKHAEEQQKHLLQQVKTYAERLEASYDELRFATQELEAANEQLRQQRDNLERLNRMLQENEERLQLAQQAGRMGSFYWHIPENRIRISTETPVLYGMKSKPLEGGIEDWLRFVHAEDRPMIEAAIPRLFDDRNPDWHNEYRIVDPDGRVRWIETRATIRYDGEGRPLYCIGFNIDITEHKRTEEELKRRTDDLIRLNREVEAARDEANIYLDIMTHDVRNANNVSSMYAELLADLAEGDLKTYAEKLRDSIERSNEILRNVATIRRAQEETGLVPVNLDAIIRQEIGNYPQASIRYQNIHAEVLADNLLPVILANLIGNAVKFGGPDVEIAVRVEKRDGEVLVSVEDTGPGIPDEIKEKLFHRFERGLARGRGEGLGLFIVRKLAERYGGRAWIEDRVPGRHEEGAAFRFTLRQADR